MITDEMLAQAADAYVQIMVDNIPDTGENEHRFSTRFERKMRKVIRRGNHPMLYKAMRTVRYAAAVLVISFLMLMAVNPSARAAVMDWIREIYASYYSHNYYASSDDAEIADITCEIGYIPETYTEVSYNETKYNVTRYFENEFKQRLYFSYSKQPESVEYFYELADYSIEVININGMHGEYLCSVQPQNRNIIQWINTDSNILLTVSGSIEKEELIQIAESIKIFIK